MLKNVNLKETLYTHWKHVSFRPLQESIINDVLHQKDVLAILPTGGGKSICYQLPALISEGTCIVISPLIALIEDQIRNLKTRNIKALSIPSQSSQEDIIRIVDNIKLKNTKLLYLSPERLSQPFVQEQLKRITISFFAIDEAHCISQWGHDFRPSYLKLTLLKTVFKDTPILALTATATPKTQQQICSLLQLKDESKHIGSFVRENLAYQVFFTPNKFDLLHRILKKQTVSSIIYLQSRHAVQELCKKLNYFGLKSTYYHAGLSKKEKDTHANLWNTEESNIMVATNAFGMGIDKSNVRLVIHLEIANSLENYLQEAGRAGRDEKKAFSCVILSNNDLIKYQNKKTEIINANYVLDVYKNLNQHFQIALGETPEDSFEFNLNSFSDKYNLEPKTVQKALQRLDNHGIITFKQHELNGDFIQITVPQQHITYISDPANKTLLHYILRHYPGVFDILKKINITKAAKDLKKPEVFITNSLQQLQEQEFIEFHQKQSNTSIQFLVLRDDRRTINPIKKALNKLCVIEHEKQQKSIAYFKNIDTCRNKLILNYFNETHKTDCGICDICISKKQATNFKELSEKALQLLKKEKRSFNDLLIALKTNTIVLKELLKQLINSEAITFHQHYFQIK